LKQPKPPLTHAQLIQRGAMWLRNRKNCRFALTEQTVGNGEIPDVIGFKCCNHSYLIECKISRADFFADRCKPFRVDPALGMGLFRHFLAPAGVLTVEDVNGDWGLLEARGRSIFVLKEALPQPIRKYSQEVSQLVQALAQAQLRVFDPLHRWPTGPESPVGQMRAQQKVLREEMKTRECSYYALPRGGDRMIRRCLVTRWSLTVIHDAPSMAVSRASSHGQRKVRRRPI
jgi:hypothetical protein